MIIIREISIMLFLLPALIAGAQKVTTPAVIYDRQDSLLIEAMLDDCRGRPNEETAVLTASAGRQLTGKPYKGQTLENGSAERLVINFREFDCTTFVECCLAIARTAKAGNPGFTAFMRELENIRYRRGLRDGYASRLHYFSEWIYDNTSRGVVTQPQVSGLKPMELQLGFMSSHPAAYPLLKYDDAMVQTIARQEKAASELEHFYLPVEDIRKCEDELREGDIVGLVTSISGLDVSHTGILVSVDGRIHLLHASSAGNMVVISEEPLAEMLMKRRSCTGIMIVRPR